MVIAAKLAVQFILAYNGDVAAGQLAVFRGDPSRTGGKARISDLCALFFFIVGRSKLSLFVGHQRRIKGLRVLVASRS
jgi:hypothetical protein